MNKMLEINNLLQTNALTGTFLSLRCSMFPELHSSLAPPDPNSGPPSIVHIVERSEGTGAFLLHHFLSQALKGGSSVIFVGGEQSMGHYHAVASKLGTSLIKARESGQLRFMEVLKEMAEEYLETEETQGNLSELLAKIRRDANALRQQRPGKNLVIIIDKLSLLGNLLGTSSALQLARGLVHLTQAESSTQLVIRDRRPVRDTAGEDAADPLTNYLSHCSDLNLNVWPLKTGTSECGDVPTGNLEIVWPKQLESNCLGMKKLMQFKLEERNVRVFAPGTSKSVL